MAEQSEQQSPPAPPNGPVNNVAINQLTATIRAIETFARDIMHVSEKALDRTTQHVEKLRKAHRVEEAASTQRDFVQETLEHAVQHTRK